MIITDSYGHLKYFGIIFGYFTDIYRYTALLFILYNFIKSIGGGMFALKAFIRKEIEIIFNFFSVYHIIFVFVSIWLIFSFDKSSFDFNESTVYYSFEIRGLQFNTFQVFNLARINTIINMFGIPIWLIYYTFSDSKIKNNMKDILNLLTPIIIIFINFILLYGLVVD